MNRIALSLGMLLVLTGCPSDGDDRKKVKVTVDPGEPEVAPSAGYVGSEACRKCHEKIFRNWGLSAHNRSLGMTVLADSDGDGTDDFQEGLDLSGDPDFAIFGGDAPRLGYDASATLPYKVQVGPLVYDVRWTYGVEGGYRQVYLTKVGRSLYILPIQYNEGERDWVPFSPTAWYTPAGIPRYIDPGTLAGDILKETSFERRCSGCHHTGLELQHDPATGEYLAGYVELNTGCESCHGPGETHASTKDEADIVNPRNLADGSEICGPCHARGRSADTLAGAPLPFEYGWSQADGILGADDLAGGATLADFLDLTDDPADFWGYRDNPLGPAPTPADPTDDSFIAARTSYQQFREVAEGHHGIADGMTCFDCHSPHGSQEPRLIRSGSTADNSHCLSCHAGDPPFDGKGSVREKVTFHMRDHGMFASFDDYDPAGSTRAGNCLECHMPRLGISQGGLTDAGGYTLGDLRSHTFQVIHPYASEAGTGGVRGMTNSCYGCHPPTVGVAGWIIWEHVLDRGGDPDSFHAATPSPGLGGTIGTMRCIGCHTTEGFTEIQVHSDASGLSGDQARVDEIVRDSVERDHGITCSACHGIAATGEIRYDNLVYPPEDLCGRCHNGAGLAFTDFQSAGDLPMPPTLDMFQGTAGSESPVGGYTNSEHTTVSGCDRCHLGVVPGNTHYDHGFVPTVGACNVAGCHGDDPRGSMNPVIEEYDGDGQLEGIQDEVRGLLALLETQILLDPNVWKSLDGRYFVDEDPASPTYPGDDVARRLQNPAITDPVKRAVFNHYAVETEGSFGVHNAARTIRLLQQSFLEIGGTAPPWVTR